MADPADVTVYYVRAIVRNAKTGATIDTVDLSSLGSGIYATSWQAPADSSGLGLFITITTLVYTDAGHTTLSDMYGQEQDTFLVYDRFKMFQGLAQQINALNSGADIDYKKIKKIVDEALAPVAAAVKKVQAACEKMDMSIDFKPVLDAIAGIDIPEPAEAPEPVDFKPVLTAVAAIAKQIEGIDIPEPEKLDLTPVLERLDALDINGAAATIENISKEIGSIDMQVPKVKEALKGVQASLEQVAKDIKEFTYAAATVGAGKKEEPKQSPQSEPVITRGGRVRGVKST